MLFCTGSVGIRIDVSICIVYRIIIRFIDSSPSPIKIGVDNLLVLIFFHELISKTTTSGKDKPTNSWDPQKQYPFNLIANNLPVSCLLFPKSYVNFKNKLLETTKKYSIMTKIRIKKKKIPNRRVIYISQMIHKCKISKKNILILVFKILLR